MIAALGGLVEGVRDTVARFRRAAWRQRAERILIDECGWSFEAAVDHVDLVEEVADELMSSGRLTGFPSPREALGLHGRSRF